MKPKHIFVVDDEESLCEILRFNLEREGYDVTTADSAEQALTLDLERFDLAILDVMMGELSGFSLARIIRSRPSTADMPVIFCTARDSAQDAVEGLDIGADDYVTKPFSVAELSARVRSVLRRSSHSSRTAGELLRYEGLVLDMDAKRASVDGDVVALTRKEFDILALLMSNRGAVLSREQIMDRVWGRRTVVTDRTVDVNITRMRRKIGRYGRNLTTRTGYGYGFED